MERFYNGDKPMLNSMPRNPRKMMRAAQDLYYAPWVGLAERTVTDDLIRTVFEIDVRVQRHSDGTPLLLPQLMTAIASRAS